MQGGKGGEKVEKIGFRPGRGERGGKVVPVLILVLPQGKFVVVLKEGEKVPKMKGRHHLPAEPEKGAMSPPFSAGVG